MIFNAKVLFHSRGMVRVYFLPSILMRQLKIQDAVHFDLSSWSLTQRSYLINIITVYTLPQKLKIFPESKFNSVANLGIDESN